jgi:hypothetical protein
VQRALRLVEARLWPGERADLSALAQRAAEGLTKACPELVEWVSPQTSLHKAISGAFLSADKPTFLRRQRRVGDQQVQRAEKNNRRTYRKCQARGGLFKVRPQFTLYAQMTFDSFDTKSLFSLLSSPLLSSPLLSMRPTCSRVAGRQSRGNWNIMGTKCQAHSGRPRN